MSRKISQKSLAGLSLNVRSVGAAAQPENSYSGFEKIDGRHPWQSSVPEGYVGYPARQLENGKVAYFNFSLAREMGLIGKDHPDQLTAELNEKILETFCIQILNEYDQLHGLPGVLTSAKAGSKPVAKSSGRTEIKPYKFMATRYLQLQHANKRGTTSGDGRSIWNGILRHQGTTWDISSRGTGVTCLAPGSVEAQRPIKTGDEEHGYGCGLADVTELFGSALMSEIFHLNGIGTERMLTIIDLGRGCGIGVRAAPNLVRPAHLFLYLKQGKLDTLRRATDYLIERQVENGQWKFSSIGPDRYRLMLREVTNAFARFAALLERNYIFAWLDWDGDNVLASGGIIDYGSIRQFGLRHDQYRYDDVQRFSTNLNEQRGKARYTLQVFAQLTSFLETGRRRPLEDFDDHPTLKDFDREFETQIRKILLGQVGFGERQCETLLKAHRPAVDHFYQAFSTLERMKTKAGMKKLPDGINRPAIFNMRKLLRELPERMSAPNKTISVQELVSVMAASHAKKADLKIRGPLADKVSKFQRAYLRLLKAGQGEVVRPQALRDLKERAYEANKPGRITGNGSEFIVEALLKAKKRGLTHTEVQAALDLFILSQAPKKALAGRLSKPTSLQSAVGKLFQELTNIAHEFEEDI